MSSKLSERDQKLYDETLKEGEQKQIISDELKDIHEQAKHFTKLAIDSKIRKLSKEDQEKIRQHESYKELMQKLERGD